MNELHDMIRVSCEEAITPDTEAQMEHEAQQAQPQPSYKEQHGQRDHDQDAWNWGEHNISQVLSFTAWFYNE